MKFPQIPSMGHQKNISGQTLLQNYANFSKKVKKCSKKNFKCAKFAINVEKGKTFFQLFSHHFMRNVALYSPIIRAI